MEKADREGDLATCGSVNREKLRLAMEDWAAPIVGIATLLCMRFRRARPILTLGAPAALALAGLYYLTFILMRHTYLRFGWPSWFARVAPLGWFAVILLALDVIVDRTWLRRWWPSAESEL